MYSDNQTVDDILFDMATQPILKNYSLKSVRFLHRNAQKLIEFS